MLMKREKKHAYWQDIMRKYKASGKSQAVFCEENKLSYATFKYYRYQSQQQRKNKSRIERPTIVPVTISKAPVINEMRETTSCEIYLPNGLRVILPQNNLTKATTRFIKELLA